VVLSGGYAWAVGIHWLWINENQKVFSHLSAAIQEFYDDMGTGVILDPVVLPSSPTPFQVTILGPSTVGPNNYACSSWSASVQGQSPFEYSWSGLFSSTDASVSGTVPQTGGHLEVYVIDSQGNHGIGVLDIVSNPAHQDYCE